MRAAVLSLLGLVLSGVVAIWTVVARRRARLSITREAIELRHGDGAPSRRIARTTGELTVVHGGGRHRTAWLMAPGSDHSVPLWIFERKEVIAACRARCWCFGRR